MAADGLGFRLVCTFPPSSPLTSEAAGPDCSPPRMLLPPVRLQASLAACPALIMEERGFTSSNPIVLVFLVRSSQDGRRLPPLSPPQSCVSLQLSLRSASELRCSHLVPRNPLFPPE
ncbi:hypothetical protein D4764_18G0009580 [Takifugu flavidus]|uniref:Uncharacterized protein n=1 Tax=Takifugu flavidus TaxID=433684 RepID=A0A5C6NRI6_9TELE|nr:hypothetical protein D4764_18G0009580 [Takifugu flavidus]